MGDISVGVGFTGNGVGVALRF